MLDLEAFVESIVERLNAEVEMREDPTIEAKLKWPEGTESHQRWEVADLVAAMANDPHLDGLRAVLYGPAKDLARPSWLADESTLRAKLLRHFEGGVVPRLELIRRELDDGRHIDLLAIVARAEMPYVTRFPEGTEWSVRVRANTSRRTATRAELLALGDSRAIPGPVRRLDLRLSKEKSIVTLTVTNAGTVRCSDVKAFLPEDAEASWLDANDRVFPLADLGPGHKDGCRFFQSDGFGRTAQRFVIKVEAIADDGELVAADTLYSSDLM